jgi:hypothetical protein
MVTVTCGARESLVSQDCMRKLTVRFKAQLVMRILEV